MTYIKCPPHPLYVSWYGVPRYNWGLPLIWIRKSLPLLTILPQYRFLDEPCLLTIRYCCGATITFHLWSLTHCCFLLYYRTYINFYLITKHKKKTNRKLGVVLASKALPLFILHFLKALLRSKKWTRWGLERRNAQIESLWSPYFSWTSVLRGDINLTWQLLITNRHIEVISHLLIPFFVSSVGFYFQ